MPPMSIATTAAAKPTMSETRRAEISRRDHVDPAVVEPERVRQEGGSKGVPTFVVLP